MIWMLRSNMFTATKSPCRSITYLEEAMMPSVDRIVAAVKEVCYR